MNNTKQLWLVVADAEGARLLHGTPTQYGHVHLEEVARLATGYGGGEHHRPTRLSQPGRSSPQGSEVDHATAHFAGELAPWVDTQLRERGIQHCSLFAPSHLLGAMRRFAGKAITGKLTEHEGELARLTTGELAKHPRITGLLPA